MRMEEQVRLFDKQANTYAKRRKARTQSVWRNRLLRHAKGDVLEVAVGAGANFPFYRDGINLTAVDFSPAMVGKAEEAAAEQGIDVELVVSDVESLDFSDDSFDTIVSTLSLCSYNDPEQVIHLFNRWCRKEGQILLMEHGRSSFAPIHWVQKRLDSFLYKRIGCYQSRDIEGIVQSGLTIMRSERYWFDMVHLIWAKPDQ